MVSTEYSPYYDLKAAYKEVADAEGVKARLVPGLVLAGKGLFNVGRFAVKEVIPRAARHVVNSNADLARERLKDKTLAADERAELVAVRDKAEANLRKLDMHEKQEKKRLEQSKLRHQRLEKLRLARFEKHRKQQVEREAYRQQQAEGGN